MKKISEIFKDLFNSLDGFIEKRENILKESRDILSLSRNVINRIHLRKDIKEDINKLRESVIKLIKLASDEPRIFYSGSLRDVLKEYVEAILLFNFVQKFEKKEDIEMPHYTDLGVTEETYILGIFDFLGELKREIMYCVKKKDFEKAWEIFNFINEIYLHLETKVILSSIIPGYKSKVDSIKRMLLGIEEFLLKIESENYLVKYLKSFKS